MSTYSSREMKKIIFALLIICSCFSCTQDKHGHEKPRTRDTNWMDKFFKDIFLEEEAIFTLWGTKPITMIPLYLVTEEEMITLYDQLTEEQKRECTIIEDYDLPENWKKWEDFQQQLDIQKFEFFLKQDPENPKSPNIWFVNILQTALTIEDNYPTFVKILGFDFESHQVVSEIKDPNSIFWSKVMQEPILLGIVFGYGKYNSLCFHWKHVQKTPIDRVLNFTFPETKQSESISLKNFSIPIFASFIKEDPIVEKYERERETIKNQYRHYNFVHLTLEKLQE